MRGGSLGCPLRIECNTSGADHRAVTRMPNAFACCVGLYVNTPVGRRTTTTERGPRDEQISIRSLFRQCVRLCDHAADPRYRPARDALRDEPRSNGGAAARLAESDRVRPV